MVVTTRQNRLPMLLSIVIPAHNEAGSVGDTVESIVALLSREGVRHEVLVVNDNSTDGTGDVLARLCAQHPTVRSVDNPPPNGFGLAVRKGLAEYRGDAAAIVMADGSDSPEDILQYWRKLSEGYDCVFGSRFIRGSRVVDYPIHKLILNRAANTLIRVLFRLPYNDVTNAFKCYRREVIDAAQPLVAEQFNLTVELPLKAIVRGFSWAVVPIRWTNRKAGVSKLKIREMGSRYLSVIFSIYLEHLKGRRGP
jgi:dolichol-phosphate mannosyltransferase